MSYDDILDRKYSNKNINNNLAKEKKKLLQEQFFKQLSVTKENNKVNENENKLVKPKEKKVNVNNSQTDKSLKEEIKILNNKITKINSRKYELTIIVKDLKSTLKTLKDKNFEITNRNSQQNNEIVVLKNDIIKEKEKTATILKENSNLKDTILKLENMDYITQIEKLKSDNLKLQKRIEGLSEYAENKDIQVLKYKNALEGGEYTTLNSKFKKQKETLKNVTNNYNKVKEQLKLAEKTIEDINDVLSYSYYTPTFKKILAYKDIVINKFRIFMTIKTAKFIKEDNIEILEEKTLQFGYLCIDSDYGFCFVNTIGEKYKVKSFVGEYDITIDFPAQAFITKDGFAIIKKMYKKTINYLNEMNLEKSKIPSKKTLNRLANIEEGIIKSNFNGEKVLIVGSRFKKRYMAELSNENLQVTWFNPYEEDIKRLYQLVNSVDVVIICISHVSHSATDILKKNESNIKFQPMTNDNVENIIARVRFVLINSQENLI